MVHEAVDPGGLLKGIRASLVAGRGAEFGTCGLPEAKARELCMAAGFSERWHVEIENPFNNPA